MAVLLLSFVAACSVRAQASSVTVELSLEQEQFLPDEDIRAVVKVTNLSGQPLPLGEHQRWLTFSLESSERRIIEKYGEPDVIGKFTLQSTMTATKRVNVSPYYNISRTGRYQMVAKVSIPEWNIEISSRPVSFDIIRGTKLREIQFGVPPREGREQAAPEVRKYILQQAEFRSEMKLYVRLTDASESRTYKLFPISRMMSFGKPEMQVDKFSNLHVLHQSGQNAFTYASMNPDGQVIARERYDYLGQSRPRLGLDENGRILIRGGSRVVSPTDLPPPDIATTNAQ